MTRRSSNQALISAVCMAALICAHFIMKSFHPELGDYTIKQVVLAVAGSLGLLYLSSIICDLPETTSPIRKLIFDRMGKLLHGSLLIVSIVTVGCSTVNQIQEGTSVLIALYNEIGILLIVCFDLIIHFIMRAAAMTGRKHRDEEQDKVAPLSPPWVAGIAAGLSLSSGLLVMEIMMHTFPLRSGDTNAMTWISALVQAIRSRQPFFDLFGNVPLTWDSLGSTVLTSVVQEPMLFGVAGILPVLLVLFVNILEFAVDEVSEVVPEVEEVIEYLRKRYRKIISHIREWMLGNAMCDCPYCRARRKYAQLFPFDLDDIVVSPKALVLGIQKLWWKRAEHDGMLLKKLTQMPVVFVEPHEKVYSPDGSRLLPSGYVCKTCGCFIPQNRHGKILTRNDIIEVRLLGVPYTGKSTLLSILLHLFTQLHSRSAYEYLYWEFFLGNTKQLPEPTLRNVFKSPPLLLECDDKAFCFRDIAGERSAQQSHAANSGVTLLCVDLLDEISVENAVQTLRVLAQSRAKAVIVAFTKCDSYDWDISGLMAQRSVGKRTKQILGFLHEEFPKLAQAADKARESITVNLTFVSATGCRCEGRNIQGDIEPLYIDELIQALGR